MQDVLFPVEEKCMSHNTVGHFEPCDSSISRMRRVLCGTRQHLMQFAQHLVESNTLGCICPHVCSCRTLLVLGPGALSAISSRLKRTKALKCCLVWQEALPSNDMYPSPDHGRMSQKLHGYANELTGS